MDFLRSEKHRGDGGAEGQESERTRRLELGQVCEPATRLFDAFRTCLSVPLARDHFRPFMTNSTQMRLVLVANACTVGTSPSETTQICQSDKYCYYQYTI